MSKLPPENQFIDISDYGRPVARFIANRLRSTSVTPVQVTYGFILAGIGAVWCMLNGHMMAAGLLLIIKSILDAADGELARIKKTPSYTGRYFDSIADIILNFLFVITIWHLSNGAIWIAALAFIGIQLQGTLYNYYYVILRNKLNGDDTSRVFERKAPVAMTGEPQARVNFLFSTYYALYSGFDRIIFIIDQGAIKAKPFPNWFMTGVSALGLGSQLMIMAIMLAIGWLDYILPFFVCYTGLILVFVVIRRIL